MGGLAGLAALANITGGLATGGFKGYEDALNENLQRDKLAEQTRHAQALESVLNTPVESLYKSLGLPVPATVTPGAAIPTPLAGHAISTINANQAAAREEQRRQAIGNELTRMGQLEQATPALPLTDADRAARLYQAGGSPADIKELMDVLYPKPTIVPEAAKAINRKGEVLAEGGPRTPRASNYIAEAQRLQAQMRDPSSPFYGLSPDQYAVELGNRLERIVNTPAGSENWRHSEIPSPYSQAGKGSGLPNSSGLPNFTVPPAQGQPQSNQFTTPIPFQQFQTESRKAGRSDEQIANDWANLNKNGQTSPAHVTLPPPSAAQPNSGTTTSTEPGKPSVTRLPLEPPAETQKIAQAKTYLEDVARLAEKLKAYHSGQNEAGAPTTNLGRAGMAGRQFLLRIDPTGIARSNTNVALSPLETEISSEAERLLREYENIKGGMRAVSGPQIQAALGAVHGGEGLSNPNAWINLGNIANAELRYLNTLGKVNTEAGRRDISSQPGRAPVQMPSEGTGIIRWGRDKNGNPVRLGP